MTPYFYDTSVDTEGAKEGNFYLGISEQTDPPATPTAIARHNEGSTTYEFSNWMIQSTTGVLSGLPAAGSSDCLIKGNVHFVAFLQTRGNAEYTIKYWFETVDSAKTRLNGTNPVIPTADTGEDWNSWQQYLAADSADPAGRTYPNVIGTAGAGSAVNIQTPAVTGFTYATTFDDEDFPKGYYATPDLTGGQWIINDNGNVFNIFYIRDTEFPFEIDT